jgi:hypothetical protein
MAFKSLADVEFVDPDDKIIGEGGFSHVKLVRLKTNKKLYALKCVVWSYKDRYAKNQLISLH